MINLLAYDKKNEIKAGALNTRLVRYIVILGIAVFVVASLTGLAYITLISERGRAEEQSDSSSSQLTELEKNRAILESFKNDLQTADSLSNFQINYSEIFIAIGSAMPEGAVINSLNVSPSTITQGIQMDIFATNQNTLVKVKNNMQANANIFETVSFQSVDFASCSSGKKYSCTAQLNVKFNQNIFTKKDGDS